MKVYFRISPYHRMLCMLFCVIRATRMCCFYMYLALIWNKTVHPCGADDTRAYGDMERHRGDCWQRNYWIKSLFLFPSLSSLTKSVPVTSYNPDCTSDGRWSILTTTFTTFMDLDSVSYLVVYGTVTGLLVFIQNILNCVLKTIKAFTGLERHGGKWLMTKFSFRGGVSF